MKRVLSLTLALSIALSTTFAFAASLYRPGETVGYTDSEITMPTAPANSRHEVLNALNYGLLTYPDTVTFQVSRTYDKDWLPRQIVEIEYAFLTGRFYPVIKNKGKYHEVTYNVAYSKTGHVLAHLKTGKPIPSGNNHSDELLAKVNSIITNIITPDMSQTDKVDAIHDYIVATCDYGTDTKDFGNAYGALVENMANCQGYAESLSLLLWAAGVENRFVWAKSKVSESGTHGFVKAKIDGEWFNVDCTVNDPLPNLAGRVKHDYVMVSDDVSLQRYDWEQIRYPMAIIEDRNWHYRNSLVADNYDQFKQMIIDAVAQRQPYITIWLEDYSSAAYSTKFVSSLNGVDKAKVTITAAAKGITPIKTAVYVTLTYR